MIQKDRLRKKYPADLTDEPWAIVAPLLPPPQASPRGGRPRQGNLRAGRNTLLSLPRSGCPWDRLPHDVWPKRTVDDYVVQWRDAGTGAKRVTA